ncbi:DUF5412 family protein [Bacillus sp. P14.5]|uniref:DUF5412 family protein n=1 Tax=Bacillus sp. P14.5 TaxID=1983400 RepID=UPI001F05F759|nr:DUF5412 family protein [Bacillus sp. P14.5]
MDITSYEGVLKLFFHWYELKGVIMARRYNLWSFYFCLLVMLSLMNLVFSEWKVSPPSYFLWGISILTLILGIMGFKDKTNGLSRFRSWFTVILSPILSIILFLGVIRFLFISEELIKTSVSPDENFKIEFYLINGGATTSFGVVGKLDGPLWFEKTIYNEYPMDQAAVNWVDDHTVTVNNKILNLKDGETYTD